MQGTKENDAKAQERTKDEVPLRNLGVSDLLRQGLSRVIDFGVEALLPELL